jgi:aminoglycoside phosphotransferase (APT) family kinase protein
MTESLDAPRASDSEFLAEIVDRIGGRVIEALPGGAVNVTHRVALNDAEDVVVRFPIDRLRANEFPVELWASRAAAEVGIPVARGLETGVQSGVPFLVSEYVEPSAEPLVKPWSRLGQYARVIGSVELSDAPRSLYSRFGDDLSSAWSSHLEYNLDSLTDEDPLRAAGAYAPDSAPLLRELLEGLSRQAFDFGLAHGDLAPRNLIAQGSDEPPVLIDWGAATTGPSPWTDARRVFEWLTFEHTITSEDYEEFSVAADLAGDDEQGVLVAMTALHVLDVTRWARDRRPDLYNDYVRRCRGTLASLGVAS